MKGMVTNSELFDRIQHWNVVSSPKPISKCDSQTVGVRDGFCWQYMTVDMTGNVFSVIDNDLYDTMQ